MPACAGSRGALMSCCETLHHEPGSATEASGVVCSAVLGAVRSRGSSGTARAIDFLFPSSFNFTVEEQAHHAQHEAEHTADRLKALANDTSWTAREAKFLSIAITPLTLLTSVFAVTAAYLEVQNGRMLVGKAAMLKENLAEAAGLDDDSDDQT
eukprot:TRINITY_DN84244_c0_g1_i1.p1 TRINITY_DN84244_c0_g1~~TRINITY_DN84244_c0_g1_i1.p1  ORF type:complete len:167 (-),score=22.84 TRINITY_DN84244_c0_g1_i1:38-499(-)